MDNVPISVPAEYLAKSDISLMLKAYADKHADKKLQVHVSTLVKRLGEFIDLMPSADVQEIKYKPFRVYFTGLHTSWAICPGCGEKFMWPNNKPFEMCPYCGTRQKTKKEGETR